MLNDLRDNNAGSLYSLADRAAQSVEKQPMYLHSLAAPGDEKFGVLPPPYTIEAAMWESLLACHEQR